MGFIIEPEEDEEQPQFAVTQPIVPSEEMLEQVEATTVSEDSEDVRDIAAALRRAYFGEQAEVGGAPSQE